MALEIIVSSEINKSDNYCILSYMKFSFWKPWGFICVQWIYGMKREGRLLLEKKVANGMGKDDRKQWRMNISQVPGVHVWNYQNETHLSQQLVKI